MRVASVPDPDSNSKSFNVQRWREMLRLKKPRLLLWPHSDGHAVKTDHARANGVAF